MQPSVYMFKITTIKPPHLIRSMATAVHKRKLLMNAEIAEQKLDQLKNKLQEAQRQVVKDKIKAVIKENLVLSAKVEKFRRELIKLELQNGKKQYALPAKSHVNSTQTDSDNSKAVEVLKESKATETVVKKEGKKTKDAAVSESPSMVDVRKLDFRIGKIIEINKHPDADTLYVEKIDCGEDKPRTVVSGLVNHVPIDEMKDKIVMILCNLKPVKMRGVTSEAMVMCASSPEKVEVLIPPANAAPGDLVVCDGYPRDPEIILNPKKKIFETCAPDLKTNADKIACFRGSPLLVEGKGPIVAPTLADVQVK